MKPHSRYLESISSKIHPPLPRTPRQSQQLLNLLTSSFRRSLDHEHPPVQSTKHQIPRPDGNSKASSHEVRNTDKHLGSILSHPLFNPVRARPSSPAKRDDPDPLGTLVNALASGRADIAILRSCLRAHRARMRSLSQDQASKEMTHFNAGRLVLDWLASADAQTRNQFFMNRTTMALVMPYLIADGYQEIVMDWLEKPDKPHGKNTKDTPLFKQNVLYEFIVAEIGYGGGIAPALSYFVRACPMHVEDHGEHIPGSFLPAANYLVQWISASDHKLQVRSIPPQLFEQFQDLILELSPKSPFTHAMLFLRHPTKPTPLPALQYAKYISEKIENGKVDRYPGRLKLFLEAAQLCLDQEKYADASWLLEFAQNFLPNTHHENAGKSDERQGVTAVDCLLPGDVIPIPGS